MGKLDKRFLYEMYTAAQGEAPEYYRCRSDEEFVRERLSSKPDDYLARTRAYFPSLSTVENSHCGKDGASQLRFYSDLWGSDVFQRHVVHQAISPRPRALVASNVSRCEFAQVSLVPFLEQPLIVFFTTIDATR